jgi:isoaspartyl peptidase/L-asparaginase-like protein (Ntn-hydrolase superfamily)
LLASRDAAELQAQIGAGLAAVSFVVAVHGGAGTWDADPARGDAIRAAVAEALGAAGALLAAGAPALDAVVAAVCVLEDCADLNAGRGSVLNAEGELEMDAAVMDGAGLRAGAVAAVSRLRNPVRAARAVLDDGAHVLLVGAGAERFARARGVESAPPEAMITEARRAELAHALARRAAPGASAASGHGTVGAVARDAQGHLAAATSTGGATAKHPGRVGDSPVFGAGTWAEDGVCAVSATGQGELFVRAAFAHSVAAGISLAGLSLDAACERALARVEVLGGRGGCVAIDSAGRVAMPYRTPAMPRGVLRAGEAPVVDM